MTLATVMLNGEHYDKDKQTLHLGLPKLIKLGEKFPTKMVVLVSPINFSITIFQVQ